jgi:uncharacterized protein YecE (DUF72 family)
VRPALSNFFASGVLALGDKLGPFLWQFPENMPGDLERFERFFELLPRDTEEAARLAKRHGPQVRGRARIAIDGKRRLRHAVELRNATALTPELFALLRRHHVAWVIADTAGRWPYAEDVTSDFVYVRLHGDTALYQSGYSSAAIRRWAHRIECWHAGSEPADAAPLGAPATHARKGRDVYVYFDNDAKVHAPFDAIALQRAVATPRRRTPAVRRSAAARPP